MIKRALIVGINDYPTAPLKGCIPDAQTMHKLLSKNGDGSPNFDCRLVTSEHHKVTRELLLELLEQLLLQEGDSAIFYFSGHGSRNILGGFLITQEATKASQGLSFHDLQTLVMKSKVREINIILDSCYAGGIGDDDLAAAPVAELRTGVTILAACQPAQLSKETADGGIFTSLLVNALEGEAADIAGKITLASIYNHADSLLTAWDQRPQYKANVSQMSPIRMVPSSFPVQQLQALPQLFPTIDYEIRLSPAYEHSEEPRDAVKESEFSMLQKFRSAGLVEPMEPHLHLYDAAVKSGRCRLTRSGRFYWRMADRNRLGRP